MFWDTHDDAVLRCRVVIAWVVDGQERPLYCENMM